MFQHPHDSQSLSDFIADKLVVGGRAASVENSDGDFLVFCPGQWVPEGGNSVLVHCFQALAHAVMSRSAPGAWQR